MRTEGQVGVDLNVLHQVGGDGCSLVHLEVEELKLHAVIYAVNAESRRESTGRQESWGALKGHVCARRENGNHRSRGQRGHTRQEKGSKDQHGCRK